MRWYVVPSTALLLIPACRSDDGNKALGLEPPIQVPAPEPAKDPIEQRAPGQADLPGPETPPPPAGGEGEDGRITPPSEIAPGLAPDRGPGVNLDDLGQRGIPYQGEPSDREPSPGSEPQQQSDNPR